MTGCLRKNAIHFRILVAPEISRNFAAVNRQLYPYYVRFIGTCAVVILHSAAAVAEGQFMPKTATSDWWWANIYDSALRWGVCVFLMLSGSLLLKDEKQEPYHVFLRKRLKRIMPTFLFWSAVYFIYNALKCTIGWDSNCLLGESRRPELITMLLRGETYYHLWFMSMIIGLYLLTPMYRIFVRHAKGEEIAYFLIVWFIARLAQFIQPNLFVIGKMEAIGFIGCFVLGHYIAKYDLPRHKLWYVLGFASFLLTAVMTYFYVFEWNMPHKWKFYDSLSPNVVVSGIAVFLAGKYAPWDKVASRFPRFNTFVSEFGQSSFGIYLVHVLALEFLMYTNTEINITPKHFIFFDVPVAIGIPLFGAATVALSAAIIFGLKRVPVLGRYVA